MLQLYPDKECQYSSWNNNGKKADTNAAMVLTQRNA